ncbi:cytochrome c biogenesis CcdA family protein [Mycolicibacterium sp. J2]|uniref:cytochrome c biogenesis CcdA family protein n=1 Tax=Mycolicibacterium sp. J2 TaxID=2993511 RepID=UPI00224A918D|nr:cytochrome c biogenesis CcdA family protein [Mycolicibacterium sp. J2]MCX2715731.1 cytochrome c biogenesis CcdA family protein [Mycolicibacterium sp. J2]
MTQIGILGAFLGGVLALLSPCSALLLPSFFAYAFTDWRTTAARTVVFLLGLAAVLVPLGAGVGAVGAAITAYRAQTTAAAAVVIMVFGIAMIVGKGFTIRPAERAAGSLRIDTPLSVFALGAVYGLAGFCSGPLLGAVLTVAVTGADPLYGALLMAVYAVGMTTPLALLALMWDRLHLGEKSWLRGRPVRIGPLHTHTTSLISGVLFIGIGVLFLATAGTANLGGILSAEAQVALQGWLGRVAAETGTLLALGLVTALVTIAVLIARIRRKPREPPVEEHPPCTNKVNVHGKGY